MSQDTYLRLELGVCFISIKIVRQKASTTVSKNAEYFTVFNHKNVHNSVPKYVFCLTLFNYHVFDHCV